jgi:predicted deacetylase
MTAAKSLVVSIHDVAPPSWDRVRRMLEALDGVGVGRRSLLVIPNFEGRWQIDQHDAFCAALRRLQFDGDELVLHGYEHVAVGTPVGLIDRFRNRWYTRAGEFLSLDYRDARDRIERGLDLMRRMNLDAHGFVAPGWLINADGLRAARDCGLEYTNSYLTFMDLAQGRSHFAPSLVFGPGSLNEDLGIGIQRRLVALMSRRPVVRVVLHPPCIDHPGRFEQILSMIRTFAGHQPVTYFDLLPQLRGSNAPAEGHRRAG